MLYLVVQVFFAGLIILMFWGLVYVSVISIERILMTTVPTIAKFIDHIKYPEKYQQ